MKITNKDFILSKPNEAFNIDPIDISDELLVDDDITYKLLSIYDGLFLEINHISDEWKLEFLKKISCKDYFSDKHLLLSMGKKHIGSNICWNNTNHSITSITHAVPLNIIKLLSLNDMSITFACYAQYVRGLDLVGKFGTKCLLDRYGYNAMALIIPNVCAADSNSYIQNNGIINNSDLLSIMSLCDHGTFMQNIKPYHPFWTSTCDSSVDFLSITKFLTHVYQTGNYDLINHIFFECTTFAIGDIAKILELMQSIICNFNYSKFSTIPRPYLNLLAQSIDMCQSKSDIDLLLADTSIFTIYPIGDSYFDYYFDYYKSSKYQLFRQKFIEKLNSTNLSFSDRCQLENY